MKTSVALCTYNGEKFLKEQLDSILNQTVKVDEIVVCDDGSTDATVSILNSYKEAFPFVFRIYQNEKNLRSVKNFEKAISLCENEIIFLSDQDDFWLPEKVEKITPLFRNRKIEAVFSNAFIIDDKGLNINSHTVWDVPQLTKKANEKFDLFETLAYIGNIITGATLVVRKEFCTSSMPFPEISGFHHDEWLGLISAKSNKLFFLDEKLIKYRVHTTQQVGSIAYEKSEAGKRKLEKRFLIGLSKNFGYYKEILKRYAQASKKFMLLQQERNRDQQIFSELEAESRARFLDKQKEFRKRFPVQSRFLSIFDRVKGKRRI